MTKERRKRTTTRETIKKREVASGERANLYKLKVKLISMSCCPGGGVLSYMGYIGTFRGIGYGF